MLIFVVFSFFSDADFDLDVSHESEAWRQAIENSDNLAKFTEKTEVHTSNVYFISLSLLVCTGLLKKVSTGYN